MSTPQASVPAVRAPITAAQLQKLRDMLSEAHAIASSLRQTVPVPARFDALELLQGIKEVAGMVHALTSSLAAIEIEESRYE